MCGLAWWQHALSNGLGCLARWRAGFLKNWGIAAFIRHYGVDLSEAVETDYRRYPTFNAFFTRALKPTARPMPADPQAVVSPVDGAVSASGPIEQQTLWQVKGREYTLTELLPGRAAEWIPEVVNGHFMTLYLSPKDYHRFHIPLAGRLLAMQHIPGKLFSVNKKAVAKHAKLFCQNERVACLFEHPQGRFIVIAVGALIVGSIAMDWHGVVTAAPGVYHQHWDYRDQTHSFERGQQLGHFQLGSTIIVLFAPNTVALAPAPTLAPNQPVRLGEVVGQLLSN